jgi:tetratricopeptide (TPR) repeat protein
MLPEAERLLRSELAKQHQSSPPDLHSANLTNFLGIVLEDQGHYPEAEACFRQAASEFETILGPQHPRLATTLANLGNLLVEEGHYQEAYRSIWRAIDIATPVLGDRHPRSSKHPSTTGMRGETRDRKRGGWPDTPQPGIPVSR